MVDALRGVWRVLVDGGAVLDLRPCSSIFALEAVRPDNVTRLGDLDASANTVDELAADRAVSTAIDEGWFRCIARNRLEIEISWDTVAEMSAYIATRKRMRVIPPYDQLDEAFRAVSLAGPARLRYRVPLALGVYRKCSRTAEATGQNPMR